MSEDFQVGTVGDPIERRLRSTIGAMYTSGSAGEASFDRHLAVLRSRPADAARVLLSAYQRAAAEDFALRWSLVYVAGKLACPEVAPFLSSVIWADLPSEPTVTAGLEPRASGEEYKIRAVAVDALEALAAAGSADARAALEQAVTHTRSTVRALAAVALLAVDPSVRDQLAQELPADDHWVLELRPATHLARRLHPSAPGSPAGAGDGSRLGRRPVRRTTAMFPQHLVRDDLDDFDDLSECHPGR